MVRSSERDWLSELGRDANIPNKRKQGGQRDFDDLKAWSRRMQFRMLASIPKLAKSLAPGEKTSVAAANGILYQISGSIEVSVGGEAKVLSAGEGLFIASGKTAALKAGSDRPSTFLHFFFPGCRPGSARNGTCRREGIIPHSGTDSRPEAGRL